MDTTLKTKWNWWSLSAFKFSCLTYNSMVWIQSFHFTLLNYCFKGYTCLPLLVLEFLVTGSFLIHLSTILYVSFIYVRENPTVSLERTIGDLMLQNMSVVQVRRRCNKLFSSSNWISQSNLVVLACWDILKVMLLSLHVEISRK